MANIENEKLRLPHPYVIESMIQHLLEIQKYQNNIIAQIKAEQEQETKTEKDGEQTV